MGARPTWLLDTNVLVSALLWRGSPSRLIELARDQWVQLATSEALLVELDQTLQKSKLQRYVHATGLSRQQLVDSVRTLASVVVAAALETGISRDPDDDAVLAAAIAAKVDLIVSGDDDLLVLRAFRDMPIVPVAEALETIVR